VPIRTALVTLLMEAVAQDFQTVIALLRERHGLWSRRLALFGVSLGTLLSSFAFMRDGVGVRLLGALGHADLPRFARSYAPYFTPVIASLPGRLLGRLAALWFGAPVRAAVEFLTVLRELGKHRLNSANPMNYADRVGPDRRVRFLVGKEDKQVRPEDAIACASQFHDGECYVVPGLDHGEAASTGPSFVEHVRYYVGTQLGDWRW
jgi:hypothetical protein